MQDKCLKYNSNATDLKCKAPSFTPLIRKIHLSDSGKQPYLLRCILQIRKQMKGSVDFMYAVLLKYSFQVRKKIFMTVHSRANSKVRTILQYVMYLIFSQKILYSYSTIKISCHFSKKISVVYLSNIESLTSLIIDLLTASSEEHHFRGLVNRAAVANNTDFKAQKSATAAYAISRFNFEY